MADSWLKKRAQEAAKEWLGPGWADIDVPPALAEAIEAVAREFAERALSTVFVVGKGNTDWETDAEDWNSDVEVREGADAAHKLIGCGCCADRYNNGPQCKEIAAKRIAEFAAEAIAAAEREEP